MMRYWVWAMAALLVFIVVVGPALGAVLQAMREAGQGLTP